MTEKKEREKMVKVLSTFPPQLYDELKAEATREGIALTELLRNIAREHVRAQARERAKEKPAS